MKSTSNQQAVLSKDNGNIVGIITCRAGKEIDFKIKRAIEYHESAYNVSINKTDGDFENGEVAELLVSFECAEDEKYTSTYFIQIIGTY